MHLPCVVIVAAAASVGQADPPPAKLAQFPSPMVEHARTHPRLKDERPPGKRIALKLGTLFLPEAMPTDDGRLFLHFHGGTLASEVAAAKASVAVISVPLGSGSATYAKPFADPKVFTDLLDEAETKADCKFDRVGLTSWSAGYGAVRAILKVPQHYDRVQFVVLLDGLHAGYKTGKPGPKESEIIADDLAVFAHFAKDAVAGRKQFVLTHSEIFPGTYASTTETADWLLRQLNLKRTPVLRWDRWGRRFSPRRKRDASIFSASRGNSAPDHVDILHSLPDLLREIEWKTAK